MPILQTLKDVFGAKTDVSKFKPLKSESGTEMSRIAGNTYTIQSRDWWKSLPYGFRWNPRSGDSINFFLPLNPQNIQVKTNFATNIISTLYGTVEEHSEVRYHDIVISGTTGITPRYSKPFYNGAPANTLQNGQRTSAIESTLNIKKGILGGFFQRTASLATQAVKSAEGTATDLLGIERTIESGVDINQNGYTAFHNFFRFLLAYKKDTAGVNSNVIITTHPLQFLNYKDNVMYDCAIRDFNLTKSASDPFLYNYTIIMRCYNMRNVDKGGISNDLVQRFNQLGLDGIETSSTFSRMARLARNAKNAAYSAVATVKNAGG